MKNYKEIPSNERLKDGNKWLENIDRTMCVISVNKYTIIRVIEAMICSMVFYVKQFRIT